ncbi:thiamine pyrophosphokinase [Ophiostoma piceae UAMH 11346]|uniref:Thiamine pyrophosphokinase n=1 Tax=Ophiostoma piceae (strain UAMH 11346) TaxID=1262450 RepID=S3DBH3_OPHP1|nr:thiamine pyrophosphokinase [Ophiostoma piceae UAMH 11346]
MASSRTQPAAAAEYEWFPARLLQHVPLAPPDPLAVVILNQPLDSPEILTRVFPKTKFKVAADGGANQLYAIPKGSELGLHDIDVIIGDLDSVTPQVRSYFEEHTPAAEIVHDDDQYSTDFTKAVKYVRERYLGIDVVAIGGLGGRIDQGISQLHHLYLFDEPRDIARGRYKVDWGQGDGSDPGGRTYLLSPDSIAFLLRPGHHRIHVREKRGNGEPGEEVFAKHVGILPMQGPSVISTAGLEWDITDWPTEFGGQMSTSNHVLPETEVVEVVTDRSVVFTIALNESWRN